MMFGTAMTFIAQHEWSNREDGGYTNDPLDSGGETKWGISKRAHPKLDIKKLTKAEAYAIYKREYWDNCNCEHIPSGMDMCVFDAAIQHGVVRAVKWYKQHTNVRAYLEERRNFYIGLRKPRFIKGWLNRVNDLAKFIDINK